MSEFILWILVLASLGIGYKYRNKYEKIEDDATTRLLKQIGVILGVAFATMIVVTILALISGKI